MAYIQPTRFPQGGVTNVAKYTVFGEIGAPVENHLYLEYSNDFLQYVAGDWTVTAAGGGTAALSAATAVGQHGILLLTNSAGGTDLTSLQLLPAPVFMSATKRMAFKAKISRNNADATIGVGLQATNTTPFTLVSGLWFQITGAGTDVTFAASKASTATTATMTAAYPTSALTTYIDLGFYYDGMSGLTYFLNGVAQGSIATTNIPSSIALRPTFGILNTTANARTMHVDFVQWLVEK